VTGKCVPSNCRVCAERQQEWHTERTSSSSSHPPSSLHYPALQLSAAAQTLSSCSRCHANCIVLARMRLFNSAVHTLQRRLGDHSHSPVLRTATVAVCSRTANMLRLVSTWSFGNNLLRLMPPSSAVSHVTSHHITPLFRMFVSSCRVMSCYLFRSRGLHTSHLLLTTPTPPTTNTCTSDNRHNSSSSPAADCRLPLTLFSHLSHSIP
jgi:hypothetical protein